jgi:hypothetical protein
MAHDSAHEWRSNGKAEFPRPRLRSIVQVG